ncbi:MAG: anthranilate synthase component I [Ignavibacteriaceae bacterium]|nr:anthranilate synthase component I [Ignavibacteriaceae bacterium]
MDFETFKNYTRDYNLIPVYEIITADLLTPVLAYLKIRETGKQSFLLESVEKSENMARYSFIGKNPSKIFSNKHYKITEQSQKEVSVFNKSIFEHIRFEINKYKQPKLEELPDFTGGLVGFLGYENIALIEKTIKFDSSKVTEPDIRENPDSIFGIYNTILAFDHHKHQIILISNVVVDEDTDLPMVYNSAKKILNNLRIELTKPIHYETDFIVLNDISENFDPSEFYRQVDGGKTNIIEGDIFQIVLSKRFSAKYKGDPLNVYRALRIINPSPYMYFLEFENEFSILGTSPEDLLKVKNKKAQVLPIAGTRKRGKNLDEENYLESELINDPKELAEHTMLVDLGRNDLGRVCKFGTVNVIEKMVVQKYSHVMHLVSKVEGELADDKDSIDALMACFPAGTVTGAPKIRAIQLINNYESTARNVYAGAVGYFDFSGNLDMCIAIRTLFTKGENIYWQAGAGIVADSSPSLEAKEIKNKSAVMITALKYAEVIDDNPDN